MKIIVLFCGYVLIDCSLNQGNPLWHVWPNLVEDFAWGCGSVAVFLVAVYAIGWLLGVNGKSTNL